MPKLVSARAERTNIVFILADDLGPDGFGCYGSENFSNSTPRPVRRMGWNSEHICTFLTGLDDFNVVFLRAWEGTRELNMRGDQNLDKCTDVLTDTFP